MRTRFTTSAALTAVALTAALLAGAPARASSPLENPCGKGYIEVASKTIVKANSAPLGRVVLSVKPAKSPSGLSSVCAATILDDTLPATVQLKTREIGSPLMASALRKGTSAAVATFPYAAGTRSRWIVIGTAKANGKVHRTRLEVRSPFVLIGTPSLPGPAVL